MLHFAASVSLVGVFVLWCFIVWPAFRRTPAALTFEGRWDRSLFVLAWVSLLAALISGGAWLAIVAANMSGMPLAGVFQGGTINVVLTQTHFGAAWIIRAGLIIVLAACLAVQARSRKHVAGWVGLIAAGAFIASLAWAGHAAATEDVPFDAVHLPSDVLHLLASGGWLGALLPLVLFLAQASRDNFPPMVEAACTATRRFSVLGITCVGTLIVTGVVNTWFLAGSVPALLGTLYGQLLLLKIALFAMMIILASVNQRRLLPRLAGAMRDPNSPLQELRQVVRNASVESGIGVLVLAIVGIMGILPPGLHTEPRWPLPFRFDINEIPPGTQPAFYAAAAAFAVSLIATLVIAERKRYRVMPASIALAVVFGIVSCVTLRSGIVRAYPTSFYASTQAFAAPSIDRGAPLYVKNCLICHGATGRGDGPLADQLAVRPANLIEPHLFAHKPGEVFWWISHGSDNGVMPGFAGKLSPDQRWDLINFVKARAAGVLSQQIGSQITTATAFPFPDFAFAQDDSQSTLSELLKKGPVLVAIFATPIPRARLEQLAKLQPRLAAAGLHLVAVDLGPRTNRATPVVNVSQDVTATLALFRSPKDGGETELMLDRGGNVRARWTASGVAGLASANTLLSDASRVARIPVAAANHAGHAP